MSSRPRNYIAPEQIEMTRAEWQRIGVAITDNLLSGYDEYAPLIEEVEELSLGPDDTNKCSLALYLGLGRLLSDLIEAYRPHLDAWSDHDGAMDIPILDYAEEFACVCEAMQIYLGNADYNLYLISLQEDDICRRHHRNGGKS